MSLQYLPIPVEFAERARRTRKDDFGHVLQIRSERGPCRICLRISTSPEDFLLLSYRPLPDRNPYAEIGPIFVHARECTPYESLDTLPEDFLNRALVLRAYDYNGEISDAAIAPPGETPRIAAQLLSAADVAEVHVRHTSYTCYDFKIVRK